MLSEPTIDDILAESRLATLHWASEHLNSIPFTSFVWGLVILDLDNNRVFSVGENGSLHTISRDLHPEIKRVSEWKNPPAHQAEEIGTFDSQQFLWSSAQ